MLSADVRDILAIGTLALAAAGLTVWITVRLRRPPLSPAQWLLFGLNYIIVRILWRTQIKGSFPFPPGHGAVLVCNHRCPVDPSFVELAVPRVIHWMVAKEYCEHPAFRRLLATCEVIPVRRGGIDMGAMRSAIRLLQSGELVGVFPEGRINTTNDLLLPFHPGAALMALKAKAPLVPLYIQGAPYDGTTLGCLFMPASVRVQIGPPIDLSDACGDEDEQTLLPEATRRLARAIARLANHPGFQPKIAGRASRAGNGDRSAVSA